MLKKRGSRLAAKRKDEITPPPAVPEPPSWMLLKPGRGKKLTTTDKKFNRITLAEWKSKTKQLAAMGVLTEWEQTPLAMICQAIAEYAVLTDQLKLEEMTYETDKGNFVQSPLVGVRNHAWKKVVELVKQFGMTPAARAGLSIAPKSPMLMGVEQKYFGPKIHKAG